MKTAIIIPARYASTRFPGKPLAQIAGKSMLARVVAIGRRAARDYPDMDITVLVATEDQRIADHCADLDVPCILTSESCRTGSDRVLEAAQKSGGDYDFLISLQGDAPFTPPDAIRLMIEAARDNSALEVVAPVVQLSWAQLDELRGQKQTTPFSGTTVIINADKRALWFSKMILPAIRNEDELRRTQELSPVHQHIGLYGYRPAVLERFVSLPQGRYEQLEGLEQLRLLENGISIDTVQPAADLRKIRAGIDSPADIPQAEKLITLYGDDI